MSPAATTLEFPASDLLPRAAAALLERERARLPDLSACIVLVPNLHAAQAMLQALGRAFGPSPLLLPRLTTLPQLAQHIRIEHSVAPDSVRQSVLYAALRARDWFDPSQLWALTDELLKLFDRLTLSQVSLPDRVQDFAAQLAHAYAAHDRGGGALQFEARLVHTLWQASREALAPRLDPTSAYLLQLTQIAQDAAAPLYAVGLDDLAPAEHAFLARYAERQPVTLMHADPLGAEEPGPRAALLRAAWCPDAHPQEAAPPLKTRAEALRRTFPDRAAQRHLRLFGGASLEHEAQIAALHIRRWLHEGRSRIAIVAQDRLAARRLRALLERDAVLVRDETGWTFSTTAASALIMRWLDLLADDFYYQDLLDFLKSPWVLSAMAREQRRDAVAALELLVREHDVATGLERYLDLARTAGAETALALLQTLDAARARWAMRQALPLRDWLALLRDTLVRLDIAGPLALDLAGAQLLELLQRAAQELADTEHDHRFAEWRHWLDQRFENASFLDTAIESPIVFTHLAATRLRPFDAVLLLGCDNTHLPAPPAASVFFNQTVRASLRLPTWQESQRTEQRDLASLLIRSEAVLATWQAQQQGEPNLPSPWLSLLDACHREAYGETLTDGALRADGARPEANTAPVCVAPAPRLRSAEVPADITASAYASLMQCPYQYFARHVLRLNPLDSVQLAIEKRDFGALVHRILHDYHQADPAPDTLEPAQREARLRTVTARIFAPLLRRDYVSRAWLMQWERLIPAYLEWQAERVAQGWHWQAGELARAVEYRLPQNQSLTLKGRLDRLDARANGLAVLDYKMRNKNALQRQLATAGEDVQLPVYALLAGEAADSAAYLSLDDERVALVSPPHDLPELAQAVATRLQHMFARLHEGAALPAHGAEAACAHCEMAGLCRRDYWLGGGTDG